MRFSVFLISSFFIHSLIFIPIFMKERTDTYRKLILASSGSPDRRMHVRLHKSLFSNPSANAYLPKRHTKKQNTGIRQRKESADQTVYSNRHTRFSSDVIEKINRVIQSGIQYPPLARRMGWQGEVELRVMVDKEGNVDDFQILKSSGYKVLDQAAYQGTIGYNFSPGETTEPINLRFSFRLRQYPVRYGN